MDTTRLAALTPAQDARYGQLLGIALDELDMTEDGADCEAWNGLCEEWPELAAFHGALPGVAE